MPRWSAFRESVDRLTFMVAKGPVAWASASRQHAFCGCGRPRPSLRRVLIRHIYQSGCTVYVPGTWFLIEEIQG
eukprot:scaffold495989_cov18-Prasinocladus_malaysianus.AAC.1